VRATTVLGTLTATALLASLAPLGVAPAGAASARDWRAAACAEDDGDLAVGSYEVAQALTQRVKQIPSLTLTAEHLVFANGARCDLLSLDGSVPEGRELTGYGSEVTVLQQMVVGGVDQGEMEGIQAVSGNFGRATARAKHLILGAQVFSDVESGTVPDSPAVPAPWRNQPYTSTHTRTTFTASVDGGIGRKKTFPVTPASTAAAKRHLTLDLMGADTAGERQAARRTYRLALRGVRYVMKSFHLVWSGELPR
jgi:hypothetical protein